MRVRENNVRLQKQNISLKLKVKSLKEEVSYLTKNLEIIKRQKLKLNLEVTSSKYPTLVRHDRD